LFAMPLALASGAVSEPHPFGQLLKGDAMELVKVQTAQATSDPEAIVYDKDRKWLVQQHLNDATKDALGTDTKAFFEAEYQPTIGYWRIGKRVSDRDW
jgi:hypothetical protein